MTEQEFDLAYSKTMTGDFFAVRVTEDADNIMDFIGINIENISGNICHIGQITNKETFESFEAQPPKLAYQDIKKKYRGKKGVELLFLRLTDKADEIKIMLDKCRELNGVPYNLGLIADLASRYFYYNLPIIGLFIRRLDIHKPMRQPLDLKKGIVCSTTGTITARSVKKNFLNEYPDPQCITPSIFADADDLTIVSRCVDNR